MAYKGLTKVDARGYRGRNPAWTTLKSASRITMRMLMPTVAVGVDQPSAVLGSRGLKGDLHRL